MVVVTADKVTCPGRCAGYIAQVIHTKCFGVPDIFFLIYMINKPKRIKYGSFLCPSSGNSVPPLPRELSCFTNRQLYHLNRKENKILPPHIFCFVFVQGYEIVRVLM